MYSRIETAALSGIFSVPVFVEVDISNGLPVFDMVGNVSTQVREGKERVKTALHNLGISLPAKRITINLSPSDFRKEGTGFDLPLAVGILTALRIVEPQSADSYVFVGELNLSGDIMPVNGILPIVSDSVKAGKTKFCIPYDNIEEARLVKEAEVYGFCTLTELFDFLLGGEYRETAFPEKPRQAEIIPDFSEVNGQKLLKRAAEISASGMHNLLLIGPPGAGKTMIAERMSGILPPLTKDEKLEISKIYSVKGILSKVGGLLENRPFRSPHHTVSRIGMTGGGRELMPGEISLAHTGVLFLDELTEFDKNTLEILRQPMEDKVIRLTRASGSVTYPSDFLLLGAMNPCNCGYYPNMQFCRCSPASIRRHFEKLSQPLLDRIDLCVRAEPLTFGELTGSSRNESSADIRKRVLACQQIQQERFNNEEFHFNSKIPASKLKTYCGILPEDRAYMNHLFDLCHLTGRTYHKLLRVARTIADMDGSDCIKRDHLNEAFIYRNPDILSLKEERI